MLSDVLQALVQFLRANPRFRKRLAFGAGVVGLIVGIIWLVPSTYLTEDFLDVRARTFPWLLGLSTASLAACLLSYVPIDRVVLGDLELQPILEQRRRLEQRLEVADPDDVFARLELNLNQITEYYTINKSQARNSFRFGVFAVTLGLGAILLGIGVYYFGDERESGFAALSTISGSLANFVGASALVLHHKSMSQLNLFFDRLSRLQEIMLAVFLCDRIEDPAQRDRARQQLVGSLLRTRVPTA